MSSRSLELLDVHLALEQIGDADAMNSMLEMLQESLTRDIPLVSELLQSGDVAAANRLLHPIKGFMPIFCRSDFCEKVAAVEALSKDPSSIAAGPAYSALRPQLELLLAEVNTHLAGTAA